jgi:2-polyprenyl-3-methyl-5-hydroxy-6-metoxy-1,4-benzoquinol methylase
MSSCCSSCATFPGTNKFFSKESKRYLKQFKKQGLAKEQQLLVKGIECSPIAGQSILEIGCGIGGLHLTLLQHGASSANGIEISEGMLESAKQLSKELGFEQQTAYHLGDFAQFNGEIDNADITILDKVVCCYEDVDTLLQKSLLKTKRLYALSYPKPTLLVRISFEGLIILAKLFRWSFRPYWHDWDRIVRKIAESGFRETYCSSTMMWTVRVLERGNLPQASSQYNR